MRRDAQIFGRRPAGEEFDVLLEVMGLDLARQHDSGGERASEGRSIGDVWVRRVWDEEETICKPRWTLGAGVGRAQTRLITKPPPRLLRFVLYIYYIIMTDIC